MNQREHNKLRIAIWLRSGRGLVRSMMNRRILSPFNRRLTPSENKAFKAALAREIQTIKDERKA